MGRRAENKICKLIEEKLLRMNFDLASTKSTAKQNGKTADVKDGAYGINDVMVHGFANAKAELESHPLELSEKTYHDNQEKVNLQMLKKIQGIHAPLRIMMENKAASHVQRLPCLSSSNIMLNSLQDNLETIGPEDIFSLPDDSEIMGYPHMMMENKLGF